MELLSTKGIHYTDHTVPVLIRFLFIMRNVSNRMNNEISQPPLASKMALLITLWLKAKRIMLWQCLSEFVPILAD